MMQMYYLILFQWLSIAELQLVDLTGMYVHLSTLVRMLQTSLRQLPLISLHVNQLIILYCEILKNCFLQGDLNFIQTSRYSYQTFNMIFKFD